MNKSNNNIQKTFSKNLKKLLDERQATQLELAQYIGVSNTTINNYVKGYNMPRMDKVDKICEFFGVSRSALISEAVDKNKINIIQSTFDYDYIESSVAAGSLERIDACYEFDKITLPDRLMGRYARRKSILATRINGQSMNRLIPDESFIFIDRNFNTLHQIKDGDVVVFHDGGEYSCKRIFIDNHNNRFIFRPDSDDVAFTDIIIDFENTENLKLIGKVVMYLTELD